jgi:hypothetical protein
MIRAAAVLVCLTMTVCVPSEAQQVVVYGDTIVEILGLRSWSPAELEAAVRRHAPNVSLASGGCTVVLRDLGFADASVTTYSGMSGDTVWVSLRVIEPRDSSLVRYSAAGRVPLPIPDRWDAMQQQAEKEPGAIGFFQHPEVLLDGADSIYGRSVPLAAQELRTLLRSHRTEDDFVDAVRLLDSSSDMAARQLAALVLSNFLDRPASWHALVNGMRVAPDYAGTVSRMVFSAAARTGRFTVDWSPAIESLEAIVGGTNLFSYDEILRGLVDTGIESALARTLAVRNPALMADHAASAYRMVRRPAGRFLQHAGAPDFGRDRAAWLDWIKALRASGN